MLGDVRTDDVAERPQLSARRYRGLAAGAALIISLSILTGCGQSTSGGDRQQVETNSGDIASNQAVANQVEASGNDQPPRLGGASNGS